MAARARKVSGAFEKRPPAPKNHTLCSLYNGVLRPPGTSLVRARGADFQVGGLTRTRKREPTRGVRGHAPPGKFEILFF